MPSAVRSAKQNYEARKAYLTSERNELARLRQSAAANKGPIENKKKHIEQLKKEVADLKAHYDRVKAQYKK